MHGKRRRRSPIRQEDGLTLEKAGILLGESYMPGSYEQVGDIKAEQVDSDLSTDIDYSKLKKKKYSKRKDYDPSLAGKDVSFGGTTYSVK